MNHISIVFKSIQAHSRSSYYSTERKLYSGWGLNWFLNPRYLIGDRMSQRKSLILDFFQKTSPRFYLDKRPKDQSQNIYRQKRKPWLNMIACQLLQIFLLQQLLIWMTIVLLNLLQSKKEPNSKNIVHFTRVNENDSFVWFIGNESFCIIWVRTKTIPIPWFVTGVDSFTSNIVRIHQRTQISIESWKMIWELREKIIQFIEKWFQ